MIASARWLFLTGSLWNFLIGGAIVFFPASMAGIFYGVSSEGLPPIAKMALKDFGAMIVMFGLGYFLVALNPTRNQGIILLGILGKLGISMILPYRYFTGEARIWILVPAVIDLVFALLYARYLMVSTWRGGR